MKKAITLDKQARQQSPCVDASSTSGSHSSVRLVKPMPAGLNASPPGPTPELLNWDDVSSACDCFVERSVSSARGFNQIANRDVIQPNHAGTSSPPTPRKTFRYRVRVVAGCECTAWSNWTKITITGDYFGNGPQSPESPLAPMVTHNVPLPSNFRIGPTKTFTASAVDKVGMNSIEMFNS